MEVAWNVDFHDDFVVEYQALAKDVQDELLACVTLAPCSGGHVSTRSTDPALRI